MIYTIAAHPTKYKGALFRSRLEATWAAFFDLCGAEWQYEPIDLRGWTPDFQVQYSGRLDVYAEVKPGRDEEELNRMAQPGYMRYEKWWWTDRATEAPSPILLGLHPLRSGHATIVSGDGCSQCRICDALVGWSPDFNVEVDRLWNEASNLARYKAPR